MKIAVDTNFLISATQWDYSVSNKLLQKLIRNNVEIFTTKEILEEFSEVLKRDFLYAEKEVQNLLEKVLQFLTLVNPSKKIDVVKEDADDNKIIECAVETKSEYNSGETLIAKISGDFTDKISSDDVSFFRKHVGIPMDFAIIFTFFVPIMFLRSSASSAFQLGFASPVSQCFQ